MLSRIHRGSAGNLMSLGAVDFSLIIDGAVSLWKTSCASSPQSSISSGAHSPVEERLHTVLPASKEVGNPMFFGVFIITIVYPPILALTGVEGKMFHPMAIATGAGAEVQRPLASVVIGGLLTSTFLKLVLLPVLYEWVENERRRSTTEIAESAT